MSLRIIAKPELIERWITERNGTPVRRAGTGTDLRVVFQASDPDYEPMTLDELLETMSTGHLVLLVEQEPGKTFHKFVDRS